MPRRTVTERFWAKVQKTETCWLWTGSRAGGRYGQFWFNEKNQGAHRAAYELTVGPIPDGLELDHLCRVLICVNPAHLEPVTHEENMRRYSATFTHCNNGHALTPDNLVPSHPRRCCLTCSRELSRAKAAEKTAARRAARAAS